MSISHGYFFGLRRCTAREVSMSETRISDVPRQTVCGDAKAMSLLAAWVCVAICAAIVGWMCLAATVYGLYRLFTLPLQVVRWIAQ